MTQVVPPGWPHDLAPPGTVEFGEAVTSWLLDRAPANTRAHAVWRKYPIALAFLAAENVEQELVGLRKTYAAARRVLADSVPAEGITGLLTAVEALGAETKAKQREILLVGEALGGAVWTERL